MKLLLTVLWLLKAQCINLECKFNLIFNADFVLENECVARNLNVTSRNETVTTINGHLASFFHDHNTTSLKVLHNTMHFIPQGIQTFFPDIERILIHRSELKSIEQADIKPFPKLIELNVWGNDIEKLDDDLFQFNPEIFTLDFSNNKLKVIGENVLTPLNKLDYACFRGNDCIFFTLWKRSLIEGFKAEVKANCQPKH